MTRLRSDAEDAVDLMAWALREREVPVVHDAARRAMIHRAAADARAARASIQPVVLQHAAWAIALAACAALAFHVGRSADAAPVIIAEPSLLELALPTGDRVSALPGADIAVSHLAPGERRLTMGFGEALFDVAPVGDEERFELTTPTARITVHGTLFVASVEARRTRIHVVEGMVAVHTDGRVIELGPGESLDAADWLVPPALMSRARRAAAREHPVEREGAFPGEPVESDQNAEEPVGVRAGPGVAADVDGSRGDLRRDEVDEAVSPPSIAPAGPRIRIAQAQRWLASERYGAARQAADAALRADPTHGAWRMVRADALRGHGDMVGAALEYERAARYSPWERATQAGYLAAWIRANELSDPRGALAALERSAADAAGSAMEEAALVLRASILLLELGRRDEAREVAVRYRERFGPPGREWMRTLASPAAPIL